MKYLKKWDLSCEKIGEVIEGDYVEYYMHDSLVAKVPYDSLVLGGGAPIYEREYTEPEYFKRFKKTLILTVLNFQVILLKLLDLCVKIQIFLLNDGFLNNMIQWLVQ